MKNILWIFIPFFSFGFISCGQPTEQKYKITSVYDGDTVYFSNNESGRIFGIDTPEMKKNGIPTTGIEFNVAVTAKKKLQQLLSNKVIEIKRLKKDKYNRHIVKIYANKIDVAKELVKSGLARVAFISNKKGNPFFSEDEIYFKDLLELQYQAFNKKIGIWARFSLFDNIFPKQYNY